MNKREVVRFAIPFLPPSVNSLYGIQGGRKIRIFLKSEARQFKEKAKLFMPKKEIKENVKLGLEFLIRGNWYFKNGAFKKLDLQNLEKILIDAIAEKYGFDDCRVWWKSAKKEQLDGSEVRVVLYEME